MVIKNMVELDEARRQIEALPSILREDYRITLKIRSDWENAKCTIFPDIVRLIEEAFGLPDQPPKVRIGGLLNCMNDMLLGPSPKIRSNQCSVFIF